MSNWWNPLRPGPAIALLFLLPAAGCSTFALGSFFSPFSIFSLVPGPQGQSGTDGTNGTDGADGQLRIYGDGSAGDVVVVGNLTLADIAPNRNTQFRNLSINQLSTLTVPSGTVLRCSESFNNEGSLIVEFAEVQQDLSDADPGQGVSHQSASPGKSGDNAFSREGGRGGAGVSVGEAQFILNSDPRGGGAGGNSFAFVFERGGRGGGRVIVLARSSISNAGIIRAIGETGIFAGSGGGGGGIIVLASPGSITNSGVVRADGGAGGAAATFATDNHGGGGGGGGGIVHLVSPTVNDAGTLVSNGGTGGADGGVGNDNIRAGGGGGGACGGNGGPGGRVTNAPFNNLQAGLDGGPGHVIQTIADPTALF